MIFRRDIEKKVKQSLPERGKVVVIYGPRQVGKTTFAKKLLADYKSEDGYFNCEELPTREVLQSENSATMSAYLSGHEVIVLDEAQTVPNIGRALKILIDAYPEMKIIATGSSSFDLANKINEPLTGRHYEFFLPPLSVNELVKNSSRAEVKARLSELLVYGSYPEVWTEQNLEAKYHKLAMLATSYLYRDVLSFGQIKNSEVLMKILQALARQVGGEVSYAEIAGMVGVDKKTVMSYVRLLEQAFIIFRLTPLMRNHRDEIKKRPKFYFYDNGILNALIGDFNGEGSMRDMGPLWENFLMSERLKQNKLSGKMLSKYYWRLKAGAEVDYVEEYGGKMHPYEFKYRKGAAAKGGEVFKATYGAEVEVVNRDNFMKWLVGGV